MVSGLTPSKWMVICLGHLIPCHTRENIKCVRSYSFFCTKKFLEKIFGEMVFGVFGVFGVLKSLTDSRHVSTRSKRCESDARDLFPFEKQKPTEKAIGGLPL